MKRLLALGGVLVAVVMLAASPASAADSIVVRRVDTSSFPTVRITTLFAGAKAPDTGSFTVRENGKIVNGLQVAPISNSGVPTSTVLAIDTSESMNKNGAIDQARAAAKEFVAKKQPTDQIAIVTFNDAVRTAADFTSDAGQLNTAIDGIVGRGGTALWDGVRQSIALYRDRPDTLPNIVVLSNGRDTVSTSTGDQARAAIKAAKATVFAVGLKGENFDPAEVRSLADASAGGQYLETADPKALTVAYTGVQQSIQNQYVISYTSAARGEAIDLDISAGGVATTIRGIPTSSQGVVTPPKYVAPSDAPSVVTSSWSGWLIAGLVVAAAGLLAYGIFLIFVRDRSVERALQPYVEERTASGDESREVGLVDTPLVQRAVDATARIARERGVLQRVEEMLDRADLPIQASEALFIYIVAAVIIPVLALLVGGLFLFFVALVLAVLLPPAALSFMAGQRQRKFTSQLPDMLNLLAGTLRAGYSLLQGVEAVAQEVEDPMGRELRRVLAEARLGRPLEDALEDAADRMKSGDFEWAVMAIRIQREVGGNLAELLDTVADTMIQRERLRREVRALTAEGRISALILGLLPVGLGLVMWSMNPEYMRPLFHDGFGQALLIGAGLLAVVGFYWMKKTIEIEV
jgi:tight adherence protein B